MKLLYVTEGVPNRAPESGDGSSMISYELIRHLPLEVEVTLLTFAGPVAVPAETNRRCAAVFVLPTRPYRVAQLRSLLTLRGVGAELRSTMGATREVGRLSAESDVTLLHGPHVAQLAHKVVGPVVLQTVDPWSARLRMDAALVGGWRSRYRHLKARRALSMARRLPTRVRLLTVGAADARSWAEQLHRRVCGIANGVEQLARPPRQQGPPVVCFVGSLNYGPNIDSAQILIRQVAPAVWETHPRTRFVIAGRQPSSEVRALACDQVTVLANVASVTDVFHAADIAVFADDYGVGVRNSVSEALAAGLPVLATAAAAREQPNHPLLTVVPGTDAIGARLSTMLIGVEQRTGVDDCGVTARGWGAVAEEYLDEIQTAANEQSLHACRCGHGLEAHKHYRRGTDCSLCPRGVCNRFQASDSTSKPNTDIAFGWGRR